MAVSLPSVNEWVDVYQRRYPRTRPNGRRALCALYELLNDSPAGGFTVRDVASEAGVGLDTVARVVQHLRGLGVLSVDGGGWVARPGGRPGHGIRFHYSIHWPPPGRDRADGAADRAADGGKLAGGGFQQPG
jgi:hypothetical protein